MTERTDSVKLMEDFIDKSLCKDCKFRVSRVISTEGLELLDQNGNIMTDDDIELVNNVCHELDLDLDHIVLKCSIYKSQYNLADHFFVNKSILDLTNIK